MFILVFGVLSVLYAVVFGVIFGSFISLAFLCKGPGCVVSSNLLLLFLLLDVLRASVPPDPRLICMLT